MSWRPVGGPARSGECGIVGCIWLGPTPLTRIVFWLMPVPALIYGNAIGPAAVALMIGNLDLFNDAEIST